MCAQCQFGSLDFGMAGDGRHAPPLASSDRHLLSESSRDSTAAVLFAVLSANHVTVSCLLTCRAYLSGSLRSTKGVNGGVNAGSDVPQNLYCRWLISWYFVDSPPSSVATQNTGAVARAPVPKPKPKPVPVVHHHTPTYYARLKAMAAKKPHHHTPTYYARLRAAQLRSAAKKKGRKLLMLGDALTFSTEQQLQLPSADAVASQQ